MNHSSIVIGSHVSVFDRLADPRIRLVVWERPNPARGDAFPDFALVENSQYSDLPPWLSEDVAMVGHIYGSLTGATWRARLETAKKRTCPAFHEDATRLRLLTTYRGPGTEWILDPAVGPVNTLPTGAVAAMKGRAWPSANSLLHRSAKATRRRPRWLLAMDEKDASAESA